MSHQPQRNEFLNADENSSLHKKFFCCEPPSKRQRFSLKPRCHNSVSTNNGSESSSVRSCLGSVIPFGQPLKQDFVPPATVSLSPSSLSSSSLDSDLSVKSDSGRKASRRASFDEIVAVVPIPSIEEYSPHVRRRMWASRSEIVRNVARNLVEYTAEGCNWRTVTEDDDMFVCRSTGELIHPIHVRNCYGDVFGMKCLPPEIKMPQVHQFRVPSPTVI